MTDITLQNIKPKFYPSIINREDFSDLELRGKVQSAFSEVNDKEFLASDKDHVFCNSRLPGYVIKSSRTDGIGALQTQDTHLYRVRKALKIQKLIEKYNLSEIVHLPKKYLYYHNNQWYVIAEKLNLTDEAPEINKTFWNKRNRVSNPEISIKKRKGLSPRARPITPEQGRALTIFAYEAGLADLNLLNLFFTNEGKIAVIDTEPLHRFSVKNIMKLWPAKIFVNKNLLKMTSSCLGLGQLKVCINNKETVRVINKTENYYMMISTIKTIAKIAFIALACCISAAISVTWIAVVTTVGLSVKALTLTIQQLVLSSKLYYARKENGEGMPMVMNTQNMLLNS